MIGIPLTGYDAMQNQKNCVGDGNNGVACLIGTAVKLGAEAAVDLKFMPHIIHGVEQAAIGFAVGPVVGAPLWVPGAGEAIIGVAGMALGAEKTDKLGKATVDIVENIPEKVVNAAVKYGQLVLEPTFQLTKMAADGRVYLEKSQEVFQRSKM